MVLGGDEAVVRAHLAHGLVVGAVAVLQLIDAGAGRLGQQLVAHADAHAGTHVGRSQELADILDRGHTGLGGRRIIKQKKTAEPHPVEVIVPGHTHHVHSPPQEAADDIGLHAAVHQDDGLCGVRCVVSDDLLAAHLSHEVHPLVLSLGNIVRLVVEENLSHHHTMLAQHLGQFAGIDARDGRHLLALEPVGQCLHAVPVAILLAVVAHDECAGIDTVALHVRGQAVLLEGDGRHAIVAHQREGECQQLPCIRGIREALGIAHHGGVEDYLAGGGALISKGGAVKLCSVLQSQCNLSAHCLLVYIDS